MTTEWRTLKLADACVAITDGTHHSPPTQFREPGEGRFKYVTSKNLRPWGLDLSDITYIDESVHREIFKRCSPSFGDVLLTKDGANTGMVAVNTLDEEFSLLSSVALIKPKSELLEPRYLRYFLESPEGSKRILGVMTGTAMRRIILRQIKEALVPIAPLPEQRQIVAEIEKQFTRLEAGVAALKRVAANLKRYRAAVLKAACEGRLVPTEAELAAQNGRKFQSGAELLASISDIQQAGIKPRRAGRLWGAGHVPDLTDEERLTMPKGWVWTKVRNLGFDAESAVQVGPMSMKSEDFTEEGVPVLNVGCVQWDRFVESKLDHLPPRKASEFDRYQLSPGDVLFTRSGTVGRCAIAQPHQAGWLMTFHLLRARPNPCKCIPTFLRAVFEGAPHIRRQTKAASVGSTRAGFNTNLLANLAVPLPPLAEQARIVAEVERRLSVVEELEATVAANLQRAARLRQSILQKAFSGGLFTHNFTGTDPSVPTRPKR